MPSLQVARWANLLGSMPILGRPRTNRSSVNPCGEWSPRILRDSPLRIARRVIADVPSLVRLRQAEGRTPEADEALQWSNDLPSVQSAGPRKAKSELVD